MNKRMEDLTYFNYVFVLKILKKFIHSFIKPFKKMSVFLLNNNNTTTTTTTNSQINSNYYKYEIQDDSMQRGEATSAAMTTMTNVSFKCDCYYKSRKFQLNIIDNSSFVYLRSYDNSRLNERKWTTKEFKIEFENILCINDDSHEEEILGLNKCVSVASTLNTNEQKYIKNKNKINKSYCILSYIYILKNENYKWRMKNILLVFDNESNRVTFTTLVKQELDKFHNRPKSLAIFINPISGNKKGVKIYFERVQPVLQLCKVNCHVVVTQAANHAHQCIQELNLNDFDGLVCVGGDGLFSEVLTSLLLRTQIDSQIDYNNSKSELKQPSKTIGIIPAGSTDAAAYCTTGFNDVLTSVYQIVLGKKLSIDVIAVHDDKKFLNFCTTLLGYGYFGDIAYDSSKLRCLGPFRYVVTGAKNVLKNSSYSGKLKFNHIQHSKSSPLDGQLCVTNCKICATPPDTYLTSSMDTHHHHHHHHHNHVKHTNQTSSQQTLINNVSMNQNFNDLNGGSSTPSGSISSSSGNYEIKRPIEIDGEFIAINCVNMSCRCAKSKYGMSPSCHTSNGCADLILVRKTSRLNYIRYLLKLSKNALYSFTDLPFVEVYRLNEFEFEVPSVGGVNATFNDSTVVETPSNACSSCCCCCFLCNSFNIIIPVK